MQGRPNPALGETQILSQPCAAKLEALRAWWDELRGGAVIPAKAQILPETIGSFLSHIQLMEVLDGGRDYRIRTFGSHWVEIVGWDFTGRLLSQTSNSRIYEKWSQIYGLVVQSGGPLSLTTNLNNLGRDFIKVEELLLPFSGSSNAVENIVAGIVPPPPQLD